MLHWYDFICPFCYVGQQKRNAILSRHRRRVVEMAFQAHRDIPPGGIPAGPRQGPVYAMLEREAKDAGLPLRWPRRLPNTRRVLAAAEWARRHQPGSFPQFHKELFAAHFALGEDLEDTAVVDRRASESGIDIAGSHTALADGSASAAVKESETIGRRHGVQGTPAWLLDGRLLVGLRPAAKFESLAEHAMSRRIEASDKQRQRQPRFKSLRDSLCKGPHSHLMTRTALNDDFASAFLNVNFIFARPCNAFDVAG